MSYADLILSSEVTSFLLDIFCYEEDFGLALLAGEQSDVCGRLLEIFCSFLMSFLAMLSRPAYWSNFESALYYPGPGVNLKLPSGTLMYIGDFPLECLASDDSRSNGLSLMPNPKPTSLYLDGSEIS